MENLQGLQEGNKKKHNDSDKISWL